MPPAAARRCGAPCSIVSIARARIAKFGARGVNSPRQRAVRSCGALCACPRNPPPHDGAASRALVAGAARAARHPLQVMLLIDGKNRDFAGANPGERDRRPGADAQGEPLRQPPGRPAPDEHLRQGPRRALPRPRRHSAALGALGAILGHCCALHLRLPLKSRARPAAAHELGRHRGLPVSASDTQGSSGSTRRGRHPSLISTLYCSRASSCARTTASSSSTPSSATARMCSSSSPPPARRSSASASSSRSASRTAAPRCCAAGDGSSSKLAQLTARSPSSTRCRRTTVVT